MTIGLFDIWVLHDEVLKSLENYWHWLPIDHCPITPEVLHKSKLVTGGTIAMSKFGATELEMGGNSNHVYIPHSVDTKIFKPIDRNEARKLVGFPADTFIVGMFLANKGAPSRKAFDQQIRAFAKFQKQVPNSMLYIHSDMTGHQGENLPRLVELAGAMEGIKLNVRYVSQYHYVTNRIGFEEMATLYNACDIVLNATRGEGFGVPIIESQACGTPVVVTNFTAMPELVIDGYAVGYSDLYYTVQESYQCSPDIAQITDSLHQEHAKVGVNTIERRKSLASATASLYDTDIVHNTYWKPLIEKATRND
jgi:glycosyltransferase involved in cell wall biosynthesis